MTRIKKLNPVVKHVDDKEQKALQAVAFSQQQLQQQLNRLQQLKAYKQEYANRDASTQPQSYSSVQLQEYHRFLAQLDDTIQRQQQVVELAQRELEIKRQRWKLSHSKSDAMHKVVEQIQVREQKQADKMEQKFMDEVALRRSIKSS